jgi:hypothetical protein
MNKSNTPSKTKNVMTPLNWLTPIVTFILTGGGVSGATLTQKTWMSIWCFILATLMLLFYGWVYVYFMFRDPNRLQTEEFQFQEHALNAGVLMQGENLIRTGSIAGEIENENNGGNAR